MYLTVNSKWNALNIPVHDRKHQLQTKELVGQCVTLIKELVQGLSNFYTYCEQRSRVYPTDSDREPLSDVNKKVRWKPLLQLNLNIETVKDNGASKCS